MGLAESHCYVVIETDCANKLVTEMLQDRTVLLSENPKDLEDRNSLAKVIRFSEHCSRVDAIVTVGDLKAYRSKQALLAEGSASHSDRRSYAEGAYCRACGFEDRGYSGFWTRWATCRSN